MYNPQSDLYDHDIRNKKTIDYRGAIIIMAALATVVLCLFDGYDRIKNKTLSKLSSLNEEKTEAAQTTGSHKNPDLETGKRSIAQLEDSDHTDAEDVVDKEFGLGDMPDLSIEEPDISDAKVYGNTFTAEPTNDSENEKSYLLSSIEQNWLNKSSRKKKAIGLNSLFELMIENKNPELVELFKYHAIRQVPYMNKGRWEKFITPEVRSLVELYKNETPDAASQLISEMRLARHDAL